MNIFAFFLFLSLSFSSTVYAQASCPLVSQNLFEQIHFIKSEPDCQLLTKILTPLQQVPQFFKRNLPKYLFIRERGINASYDHGEVIWIPKNLYAYNESSKMISADIDSLAPILLHEIGHFFLHERLKKEFSNEYGDLFKQFESVSNTSVINALSEKPSMSSRRFGAHISESLLFKQYQAHLIGYAELYADTVAVVYFNNLDIIYNALEFVTHTPQEKKMIELRKFSQRHTVQEIEEAQSIHGEFSMVRALLGELLKPLLSSKERLRVLNSLEEAILLQARSELSAQQIPRISERNENLIKSFLKHYQSESYFIDTSASQIK